MTNREAIEALERLKHCMEYTPPKELEAIGMAITALKSPRPDWTPCAEGLPEGSGTYLVYAPSYRGGSSTGLDVINGVMFSRFKNGKWSIEHGYYKRPNCVLAWQPLPAPYNPDRKEDADHIVDANKKIEEDDVSQWPDWKKRAALSNYELGKED